MSNDEDRRDAEGQSHGIEKRQGSDPASSHSGDVDTPQQGQPLQGPTLEAWRWSGPLPPPEILGGYDQVVSDGAERVFRMAEGQSEHRRRIENRASWTETFLRIAGWASATGIGIIAVGGSLYLIYEGRTISGLAALLMSVAVLVGAFQGQKRRLQQKSDQLSLDLPDESR